MEETQEAVRSQYATDQNLNARAALHAQFSTNPHGWHRWVFDHLTDLPGRAGVLELGCGPADLWNTNRDRVPDGWALILSDLSQGMVDAARQKLAAWQHNTPVFEVVDAQEIPYDDAAFDGVIANHMLYHVPDRHRALEEMRRVLKPQGKLYATTVGETHMRELWELVEPYEPEILERVGQASHGFSLENGVEQLREVFTFVERYDYPDDLEVTEV
ncbi:MAG: class I SAM-dependent methyltransferase [Anaerolineae bacterium]